MQQSVKKMEEDQSQKLTKLQDNINKALDDGSKKQQEELKKLEEEVKKDVKKQKERIDDGEVKAVMAEMINKVAQDYMDNKYEEALIEVSGSID